MKRINTLGILACVLLAAIFIVPTLVEAGAAGVTDPTITVTDFTPSAGFGFRDDVHASLDSLDTAVEAVIDVADGLVGGTTAVKPASGPGVLTIQGNETNEAYIALEADDGDDADDTARIAMGTDGTLDFRGTDGTNDVATLDMSTGDLVLDGDVTTGDDGFIGDDLTVYGTATTTNLSVIATLTLGDTTAASTVALGLATNAPSVVSTNAPVWLNVTVGGEIYVIRADQLDD